VQVSSNAIFLGKHYARARARINVHYLTNQGCTPPAQSIFLEAALQFYAERRDFAARGNYRRK
jgi:hypothetical protein